MRPWKLPMKRLLIFSFWLASTLTTLGSSVWLFTTLDQTIQGSALVKQEAKVLGAAVEYRQPYLAYAAIPEVVTELKTAMKTKDARPVVIENYLRRYQSPMVGFGAYIVTKAQELGQQYSVDPTYLAYLTIAIAQNESNLGKKMPDNCHNAWGYGIHSAGTLCFENWEEGISRFMTGVAEDFIAERGLETPEEIMTRYTPHSPNGAWARGVNQFLNDLYEGRL
jgi:hypothetical protein